MYSFTRAPSKHVAEGMHVCMCAIPQNVPRNSRKKDRLMYIVKIPRALHASKIFPTATLPRALLLQFLQPARAIFSFK